MRHIQIQRLHIVLEEQAITVIAVKYDQLVREHRRLGSTSAQILLDQIYELKVRNQRVQIGWRICHRLLALVLDVLGQTDGLGLAGQNTAVHNGAEAARA